MNTQSNLADAIVSALITEHGAASFWPQQAVQIITRDPLAGNAPKHVERDTKTLRALGIEPQKIAGRWVVTAGQIAAFLAASAAPSPARIDRRRREHRHLRAAAAGGEVRHG